MNAFAICSLWAYRVSATVRVCKMAAVTVVAAQKFSYDKSVQ